MRSRFVLAIVTALAVALVAGVGLWAWADNDARVSRLSVAFNYGLLVGAALAAVGLFEQVAEARRSRQDGLRPVLIVTEAHPQYWEDEGPARLTVRNIGPGPALDVEVEVWVAVAGPMGTSGGDGEDDDVRTFLEQEAEQVLREGAPPLRYPWTLNLGAGVTVSVPVWRVRSAQRVDASDRLRFRFTYSDVFGNRFVEPLGGSLGHVWVRDENLIELVGDHELHFS